jgi:ADP-ribose pyrophosphatase YjhB (NUDIX family)
MKLLRVAGGIVWRETAAGLRIAVVHRARRDDWSLPKGRLDAGEAWHDAARREIAEETGCDVRLERFAGAKLQVDRPDPKLVLYWHARVLRAGAIPVDREVDEVAWLSRREALSRLDHESDRRLLLRALAEPARRANGATRSGALDLGSLVILDSRKAEEALPSALELISRAVTSSSRHPARDARRA